jgi:Reverse transcriptase (RNA-dependent DNA polymerase)
MKDFLKDKYIEIKIADFTLEKSKIDADISQGSLILPILYLFYNADLLNIYENPILRTSLTGFIDDVNLLTYGISAEGNYRNLERIYNAYENWAKRYGSKFNLKKYELLYLTRTPKRFNIKVSIKIDIKEIYPV